MVEAADCAEPISPPEFVEDIDMEDIDVLDRRAQNNQLTWIERKDLALRKTWSGGLIYQVSDLTWIERKEVTRAKEAARLQVKDLWEEHDVGPTATPLERSRVYRALRTFEEGVQNQKQEWKENFQDRAAWYLWSRKKATEMTGVPTWEGRLKGEVETTNRLPLQDAPDTWTFPAFQRDATEAVEALQRSIQRGGPLPNRYAWITEEAFLRGHPNHVAWLKDTLPAGAKVKVVLALAAAQVATQDSTSMTNYQEFTLPCTWEGEAVGRRQRSTLTVDTGAQITLISYQECCRLGFQYEPIRDPGFSVVNASNDELTIRGKVHGPATLLLRNTKQEDVPLLFSGRDLDNAIVVVDELPCPMLLGLPALRTHDAVLHVKELSMSIGAHKFEPETRYSNAQRRVSWASQGQANRRVPVVGAQDVLLLPGFAQRVPLYLGHSTTSRYFSGHEDEEERAGYHSVDGLLDEGPYPYILLQNLTAAPIHLSLGAILGSVTNLQPRKVYVVHHRAVDEDEPWNNTEDSLAGLFQESQDTGENRSGSPVQEEDPSPELEDPDTTGPMHGPSLVEIAPEDAGKEVTRQQLESMLDSNIPLERRDQFLALMWRHRDIWTNSFSRTWDCGQFEIKLKPGSSPYKARTFRFPHAQMEPLRLLIDKWLDEGVIEPSNSPWASSAFFVPKPGGGLRFVVDYRVLNANTIEDRFPLPEIQDIFNNFQGHEIFSTFDALSGFNQQAVHKDSQDLTSFVVPQGTFRSTRLSMGLRNGPASFQRGMTVMCRGLHGMNVYIDDVSISNGLTPADGELEYPDETLSPWDLHFRRVEALFEKCTKHSLRLNPKKCIIGAASVKYLGYIISKHGLLPDPVKVEALQSVRAPQDPHEIRVFLGLINYYRSFIRDCARLSIPLNDLLAKGVSFDWTPMHQLCFEALRDSLAEHCLRNHFVPGAPLELYTDCSDYAMGAVLSQRVEGVDKVLAFFSRSLQAAERNYSVYQKECLAIVGSMTYFHQYLAGTHFTVFTDHYSLASVLRWKDPPQRIARWIQILDQYHFTAVYKAGSIHANADALSRLASRYVSKELPGSLEHLAGVTTVARLDNMLEEIIPPLPWVEARSSMGNIKVCQASLPAALSIRREWKRIRAEAYTAKALTRRHRERTMKVAPAAERELTGIEETTGTSTMPYERAYAYVGSCFTDPDDQVEYVINDIYLDDNLQAFVVYRSPVDPALVPSMESRQPIYFDTILQYLNQGNRDHPDKGKTSLIHNEVEFRQEVEACITQWKNKHLLLDHEVFLIPDDEDNLHYYRRSVNSKTASDHFQLLIPDSPRGTIMREHLLYGAHEMESHVRFDKMIADLQRRVWWPGMYVQAKDHARSCEDCQARGSHRDKDEKGIPILKVPRVYRPFDRIAVDVLGPLSSKKGGKAYVVVAVDHYTRWVEAEAYDKAPDAETINQFMIQHFYFRHGAPKTILADNGSNLTANQLNSYLFEAMGSRVRNVSAYHPQANGMVERFNKPICDMLAAFCTGNDGADWHHHLDAVIHSLNTSVCKSTGFTPFFLVHGREARRVIDQRLPSTWGTRFKTKTWTDYASGLLSTLHKSQEMASQRIDQVQSLYNAPKVFHQTQAGAQTVQPRYAAKYLKPFVAGDWVLLFNPVITATPKDLLVKKLAKYWRGPFQVIRAISEVMYVVLIRGKEVSVHLSRIKAFHQREPHSRQPY